ncbi:hypothetical protein CCP3SC5AM1_1260009 [Gammaproteobacteria bacterium]
MTEAFKRGFIKAAMDNGLDIYTAANLLKQAGPLDELTDKFRSGLHSIGQTAGGIGGVRATDGAAVGAPLGALAGGGLGAGLGYLSGDEDTKWRNAAIGGGLGAMPGAALGAGVGGLQGGRAGLEEIKRRLEAAMNGEASF